VTTAVAEGTTFILYLPALAVMEPETEPEEEWTVIQGQGETILVVEDNLAMRQALVDSLELLNYRALQAANGREALTILEEGQKKIALVLSDVVMPEMGGIALFHAMRQRNLLVPVVMLTGHPMEEELGKLQAQGLSAWMLKPPRPEQLAQTLAQALREGPGES
jgi:CheY-like chemotaxis protein